MPPPVYSERFVMTTTPQVWTRYTVPGGFRAVVRSIVVCNEQGTASDFVGVQLAANYLLLRYPAANATEAYELRQVIYEGEWVEGYSSNSRLHLFISGYLFEDTSGRAGPPGGTSERPFEGVEVLPAGAGQG